MNFDSFLASLRVDEGEVHAALTEGWMQGRTAYGGLSAAFALAAARLKNPYVGPLRSAQISFVGPLAGAVRARVEVLRQGKSAAFVGVDVFGEAGLGLRATFVFMRGRASHVDYALFPPPESIKPEDSTEAFKRTAGPHFTSQFDYLHARAADTPAEPSDFLRWVRLAEKSSAGAELELMVLGDALPPAAMGLMVEKGPVSSMNWTINLLSDAPKTRNGWWLLRSRADQTQHGCSSQSMGIWDADGRPVATAMQSVALFT